MLRHTIRTAALAAGLVLGCLQAPGTANAASESCRGEAATLVGEPNRDLTGTEARDVVVTAGAHVVDTLGGDDLVCVSGAETILRTGAGNDVVDATSTSLTYLGVTLGPGSDHFEGAATTLEVWTGEVDSLEQRVDDASDDVIVSSLPHSSTKVVSGQLSLLNPDVIRLAGGGSVRWEGGMAPGAELTGGDGANTLSASLPAGEVAVDLAAGTATGSGPGLRWSGFESHFFSAGIAAIASLNVAGTPQDDDLSLSFISSQLRVVAELGAGDDVLTTNVIGAPGSYYDGGRGRDRLGVAAPGNVSLDLLEGRLVATHRGTTRRMTVSSFRDAHVYGRTVEIDGTDARDRLVASGCRRSVVRGRSGADHITYEATPPLHDGARGCARLATVRFEGQKGNDVLVGGPNADVLVGGDGRDRVVGRAGRDRCLAETTSTCEVRRSSDTGVARDSSAARCGTCASPVVPERTT